MSPSSSTTNSSSSTTDTTKSPSSSTTSKKRSPSGCIAVSSISGRPSVSSYSCDFARTDMKAEKSSFCTTDSSVSVISSILL